MRVVFAELRFQARGLWQTVRPWLSYAVWLIHFKRWEILWGIAICAMLLLYLVINDPTPEEFLVDLRQMTGGI